MKYFYLVIVCCCCVSALMAQEPTPAFMLDQIDKQQQASVNTNMPGIFPSYISGSADFNSRKRDENIFFNGLISMVLQDYDSLNTADEKRTGTRILNNQHALYAHFKNAGGRNTYNFWRTDTVVKYPYAGISSVFTKNISLPDDLDDTVLSMLAQNADSSSAAEVHLLMQQYINADSAVVRTVFSRLKNLPAYSTWFGKKFPVVFDVSVLCNILLFTETYHLRWTNADSASLKLILDVIQHDDHLKNAAYVSPYYPESSLILYHIARLMYTTNIPQLEAIKTKLVIDASVLLAKSDNLMEQVVLSSALMKWGYMPTAVQLPDKSAWKKKIAENDFYFFAGNIPSYFRNFYKVIATQNDWGIFYHYCPAFNYALVYEYLLLRRSME